MFILYMTIFQLPLEALINFDYVSKIILSHQVKDLKLIEYQPSNINLLDDKAGFRNIKAKKF